VKRILVVDDEESIRLLFQEELTDAGYEVATAKSGEEALIMIRERKPDLITLDIKMAQMDGADFLQELRKLHRDLPVIVCTAYDAYRQDFRLWVSDSFITKSSDITQLKTKIRELLGNENGAAQTT
jgi:CheY-like chemotaxis protein